MLPLGLHSWAISDTRGGHQQMACYQKKYIVADMLYKNAVTSYWRNPRWTPIQPKKEEGAFLSSAVENVCYYPPPLNLVGFRCTRKMYWVTLAGCPPPKQKILATPLDMAYGCLFRLFRSFNIQKCDVISCVCIQFVK